MNKSREAGRMQEILSRELYNSLGGPIQEKVIEIFLHTAHIEKHGGYEVLISDVDITSIDNEEVKEKWVDSGLGEVYRKIISTPEIQQEILRLHHEHSENKENHDAAIVSYLYTKIQEYIAVNEGKKTVPVT